MHTKLTAVVAYDKNLGIAKNGLTPWDLPIDRRLFYFFTQDLPVIFGAKTFQTLLQPLKDREVLVLSRQPRTNSANIKYFSEIIDLKNYLSDFRDVVIGGGQQVYELFIDNIDTIIATEIDANFSCDRFFPKIDLSNWSVELLMEQKPDEFHKYSFRTLRYDRTTS